MKKLTLSLLAFLLAFSIHAQVITTIVGLSGGCCVSSGLGGPATGVAFCFASGLAVDAGGNIYACDASSGLCNSRVDKIDPSNIITVWAGTTGAMTGFAGDGGPATAAQLFRTNSIYRDGTGNTLICDFGYDRVRQIDAAGIITTIAGNGSASYTGDGVIATLAGIRPAFVCKDASGNLLITDGGNNRIRKVDASGIISTIAGTGVAGYSTDGIAATAAQINVPQGICVDASGNIIFSDAQNRRIRSISPAGIITTIAGTGVGGYTGDGGPATAAQLGYPVGLRFGPGGALYFADEADNVVRMINSSGIISTVAGNGMSGGTGAGAGDGGSPLAAELTNPTDVCFDAAGNTYITSNQQIRKICNPPAAATLTGTASALCIGATTILTASISGGTWSAVTGNASVGTSGIVTGVSAGVDTVQYTLSNSCYFTKSKWPVTVNAVPVAAAITGTLNECPGATTTLSDVTPGGVWSSVSPSFASIDAAGNVTGRVAGTSTISYTVTNACGSGTASMVFTVNPLPAAGTITGVSSVCVGTITTVSDATAGGVWSSVFPSFATVDVAGSVAGIATGTDTIKYTVTNTCGTAVATYVISINTTPTPVTISGSSPRCIGLADTFTSTGSGGAWTSSDASVATIGTASGIALGLTTGLAIISYTQTDACGTVSTAFPLTIIGPPVVGAITGVSSMCVSSIFTLTVPDTGGTWRSTNLSVAFMDTAGNIYGAGAGVTIISYTKTNACGTTAAMHAVTVLNTPHVSVITGADTVCAGSYIILHDSVSGGSWSAINARVSVVADTISAHITGTDTIMYRIINMCGRDSATRIVHIIPPCDSSAFTGNAVITISSLSVIPNPAHSEVTLKLTYPTNDEATVTITNELGQAVDHFTLPANKEKQLPLHLAPGLYNITATLNGERFNTKIIVE